MNRQQRRAHGRIKNKQNVLQQKYEEEWNEKKGKYGKVPKNPATGYGAKANDPETWATYVEAVSAMQSRQLDGVGFEFAAGYMGIDLDNVINEAGEINQLKDIFEYKPNSKPAAQYEAIVNEIMKRS